MVLWAAGWSYLLLALFYLVIDVIGLRFWAFPFVVIGMNAITLRMSPIIWSFRSTRSPPPSSAALASHLVLPPARSARAHDRPARVAAALPLVPAQDLSANLSRHTLSADGADIRRWKK